MPSSNAGRAARQTVPAAPAPLAAPRAPFALLDPSALIPIYALLVVAGYWYFHSGRATYPGAEMSRQRALFTVVEAATLTGFQQSQNDVNSYRPGGQAVMLGLIVAGICFTLIAGGLAVVRIARMRVSDRAIVAATFGSVLVTAAIGAAVAPLRHMNLASSIFQAISAWGNCGLFRGHIGGMGDPWTHGLLLPLAALGGFGLPVLLELIQKLRRNSPPLSQHTCATLAWSGGVYLLGAALLLLAGWFANSTDPTPWRELISTASCQTVNTRSAGFAFSFATYWPRTVQWIAIGLMLIGAAPAGTAGGLKVTTLAVLATGARRSLAGSSSHRALGVAITWLAIYLGMLAIALLLLLVTEPQMPADRVLFLAASALGNVGLSHDPITASDAGLYVLSGTMLAGRVAPVLVLWWMVDGNRESEIAVG